MDIGAFASGPETLVVTTLADSVDPAGPVISLRDAMTFVNSVEPIDGDSIIFAPGLQGTIALSSAHCRRSPRTWPSTSAVRAC